jgi:hypothetical protein
VVITKLYGHVAGARAEPLFQKKQNGAVTVLFRP